jgi:metal-responsive CopG/Arc/MetJ family transcriptional regulator
MSVPKKFLNELDKHLENFALTDRSRWVLEAAIEKMAREKLMLSEIEDEKDDLNQIY